MKRFYNYIIHILFAILICSITTLTYSVYNDRLDNGNGLALPYTEMIISENVGHDKNENTFDFLYDYVKDKYLVITFYPKSNVYNGIAILDPKNILKTGVNFETIVINQNSYLMMLVQHTTQPDFIIKYKNILPVEEIPIFSNYDYLYPLKEVETVIGKFVITTLNNDINIQTIVSHFEQSGYNVLINQKTPPRIIDVIMSDKSLVLFYFMLFFVVIFLFSYNYNYLSNQKYIWSIHFLLGASKRKIILKTISQSLINIGIQSLVGIFLFIRLVAPLFFEFLLQDINRDTLITSLVISFAIPFILSIFIISLSVTTDFLKDERYKL